MKLKKNPINFAYQLSKLWFGANLKQLKPKLEDHGKKYTGKKISLSTTFSVTFVCNFECSHCGADIDNSKAKLDIQSDKILSLIKEMSESGMIRVGFTGGEPLVRKGIDNIIQTSADNNLMISLTTNGWFVKRYSDVLKNVNLLTVSIDGTEGTHDFIRRKKGSFAKAIEAVKIAKANNIPVLVNTTIMSANLDNIPEMNKLMKELNVNWSLEAYIEHDVIKKWQHGSNLSRPTDDLFSEVIKKISDNKRIVNSDDYLNMITKKQIKAPNVCFAGIGYSVISPEGELYPCFPAMLDPKFKGMDLKVMSFREAFEEMPLYRSGCSTCDMVCHMEMNSLYSFSPNSIKKAFKYLKK
tara:strand:- start:584 stop:1645 length:1062 start_codon:yes stop_codon:yes gene_type:complete